MGLSRYSRILLLGGGLALLFSLFYRIALESAETVLQIVIQESTNNRPMIIFWFAILGLLAWEVFRVVRWNPDISGGGMAHFFAEYHHNIQSRFGDNIFGNLTGGTLSLLGGLSIGTESPVVQIGASASGLVGRRMNVEETTREDLLLSGAGIGFSTGFSAPITGLVFCLTNLKNRLSLRLLAALVILLGLAYLPVCLFYGFTPIFALPLTFCSWSLVFPAILCAILCGAAGSLYARLTVAMQYCFDRHGNRGSHLFWQLWGVFMLSGAICFTLPWAAGSGNYLFPFLDIGEPFRLLALILVAKFALSVISPTCGAPGGMMYPMLALGAVTGKILGETMQTLEWIGTGNSSVFILVGMTSFFCAATRMNLVGILLVLELTWRMEAVGIIVIAGFVGGILGFLTGKKGIFAILEDRIMARYYCRADEKDMPRSPEEAETILYHKGDLR